MFQRLREIGDEIIGILDPHADAHQIVGDPQHVLARPAPAFLGA